MREYTVWGGIEMLEPDLNASQKNIIGAIDKLTENIALTALSVFPTFFYLVFQPRRLAPLLLHQEDDGRKGMLLGPGVFFVFAIIIIMVLAGFFVTPEILKVNGSFLGAGYAYRVTNAAAEGNIWQVISYIGPLYIFTIIVGVLGQIPKRWIGPNWTLHVSLRAAFYQMATSVFWIIGTSAVIDNIGLTYGIAVSQEIYSYNSIPIFGIPAWQYFCFMKEVGSLTPMRALIMAAVMIGLITGLNALIFIIVW
ncbi:hypothetical protein [Kordiimonas sp. SCSIO 12610]|uniref:hypothetical protein n=1 Tax=Kordiimonas sp. SCSIO 12610 TaxID=2829597 RepID=UPI00210B2A85|nr:hypothetical protein [Kordiimonas sp. SCSIO 12610]UTW56098.1 hypothetical protein KFF44_04170 [Kordiimonas sp. SCSIO 12610]